MYGYPHCCMIVCWMSMWDTHISLYFQLTSLDQSFIPWSRIWYETCCFVFAFRPSQWFRVKSSDGLYLCLGAFWRKSSWWCWLESDHRRHYSLELDFRILVWLVCFFFFVFSFIGSSDALTLLTEHFRLPLSVESWELWESLTILGNPQDAR